MNLVFRRLIYHTSCGASQYNGLLDEIDVNSSLELIAINLTVA